MQRESFAFYQTIFFLASAATWNAYLGNVSTNKNKMSLLEERH
jgi:hypothetical protein